MFSLNNKMRDVFFQPNSIYARPLVRRIVLGLAFFILFMIILSTEIISQKVSLKEGQVSDRDIAAPRSVSYVNNERTKKIEDEVLASIANVYDLDVGVIAKTEEEIAAIFKVFRAVLLEQQNEGESKRQLLINALRSANAAALPDSVLSSAAKLEKEQIDQAELYIKQVLRKYFQRGIRDDDLDYARKAIVIDVEGLNLDRDTEVVVAGVSQTLLKPNFIFNVKETDKRKQAALAKVEPVRESVKKGQILVRRGDVLTAEQIHVMEELGMYAGHLNETRIIGLAAFMLAVLGIFLGYLYRFANRIYDNDLLLVLMGLVLLLTLLLCKASHYYSDFIAPVAAGALLTAILIDGKIGILMSIVTALLFGVIADNNFRAVGVALIGSMAGVYTLTKLVHGYSLTKAGVVVAVTNFLLICATGLIEQLSYMDVLFEAFLGALNGLASAVITIGLLPYLEHTFGIVTPIKLLDYTNPNNPLLQRMLYDAPGTYHHSILVSNLAEAAADAVGADPITVRVGAYYHDIGKIKRPYFFVENQVAEDNPHDRLSPNLSTLIVTSHVKDGIELCQEYKLPQPIMDIIQQHHGTTLVSYFYMRATENEHSECIIESDFRYEGPRPQSKEAALVMLADACEAAVRSLSKPNINRVEATVRKIIKERLYDGQLDDCNLTLRDLKLIGDVYIKILSSMFHSRIEYPDAIKEFERRNAKNGNNNRQCSGKDSANGQD